MFKINSRFCKVIYYYALFLNGLQPFIYITPINNFLFLWQGLSSCIYQHMCSKIFCMLATFVVCMEFFKTFEIFLLTSCHVMKTNFTDSEVHETCDMLFLIIDYCILFIFTLFNFKWQFFETLTEGQYLRKWLNYNHFHAFMWLGLGFFSMLLLCYKCALFLIISFGLHKANWWFLPLGIIWTT